MVGEDRIGIVAPNRRDEHRVKVGAVNLPEANIERSAVGPGFGMPVRANVANMSAVGQAFERAHVLGEARVLVDVVEEAKSSEDTVGIALQR